jgi:hypothetical protein
MYGTPLAISIPLPNAPLLKRGVAEEFILKNTVISGSFGTVIDELISDIGKGSATHASLLASLQKKLLPVPSSVNSTVELALRSTLACVLKHSNLIATFTAHGENLLDPPKELIDIWTLVYTTQLRQWIKMEVQALRDIEGLENTLEDTYETVSKNVINASQFLLKLRAEDEPIPPHIVLGVVKIYAKVDIAALEKQCLVQRSTANSRANMIDVLHHLLASTTSRHYVWHDLLYYLMAAIFSNGCHYKCGIEGSTNYLQVAVSEKFESLAKFLLKTTHETVADEYTYSLIS